MHQATKGTFKDNLNDVEIAKICRIELLETIQKPYQDGCMYHNHMKIILFSCSVSLLLSGNMITKNLGKTIRDNVLMD